MRLFFVLFLFGTSLFASIGTVLAMRGEANRKPLDMTTIKPLHIGDLLEEGDEIITQSLSRVQVMLKDHTVITIGANSNFKFDKYFFDGTKNSKLSMEANRGFFRSVSGEIGKVAPQRFTVKTTSATIGIRGTDFSGYILPDQEFYRCYSGTIFVAVDLKIQNIFRGDIYKMYKKENKPIFKKLTLKSLKKALFDVNKKSKNKNKNKKEDDIKDEMLGEDFMDEFFETKEQIVPIDELFAKDINTLLTNENTDAILEQIIKPITLPGVPCE